MFVFFQSSSLLPSVIKTRRLTLCIPEADDASRLFEGIMSSMEALSLWLPWVQAYRERGIEVAHETIKRFREEFEAGEAFNFLIKVDQSFVGMAGLMRLQQRDQSIELGYWLVQSRQGKGYVTEAANALTRYAFTLLGVKKVVIICAAENVKSSAVARRLNFVLSQKGADLGLVPGHIYEKYECSTVAQLPSLSVTFSL